MRAVNTNTNKKNLKSKSLRYNQFTKIIANRSFLAITVFLVGAVFAANILASDKSNIDYIKSPSTQSTPYTDKSNSSSILKISLAGDFLAHDSINDAAKIDDKKYSYSSLYGNTKDVMKQYDVRFCNNGVLNAGSTFGISGYPQFNAPVEWASDMVEGAGCNLINLAHNHINDKNQAAINSTINAWEKLDVLAYAGANRSQVEHDAGAKLFTVKGVTVAFLAYSTYTNLEPLTQYGLNMWDDSRSAEEIKKAKTEADIVIVSMRWGTEYSNEINSEQQRMTQILVDSGADIVVGHGPHVLQPVEKVKDSYVFYSIGNYFHAQIPNETLYECLFGLEYDIANKKLETPTCEPMYMHYDWSEADKKEEILNTRSGFRLFRLSESGQLPQVGHTKSTASEQREKIKSFTGQEVILK